MRFCQVVNNNNKQSKLPLSFDTNFITSKQSTPIACRASGGGCLDQIQTAYFGAVCHSKYLFQPIS